MSDRDLLPAEKRLTSQPDERMKWIYDMYHPDYHSDRAKDLRTRRWLALNSLPEWMKHEALSHGK